MKKLLLVMAIFATTFIFNTQSFATRALKVVADLDHEKGKIGTYRALVIGIQNYNDPKIPDLQTPLNDVKAISDVLQNKYGFKVETLLNSAATKKAMYDSLRNLSSSSKDEDSVLIYYAGHGDFDRQYDDGWWIPVNAKGGDPVTYLDNVQIQKAMRRMKAKHVLLISDSCYSGTLFGQARAMPSVINDKYYINLYNEKSRWGMTSGNKTPVSDSGTGGNSVFAYQLIKKLKNNDKPYISTQEIYTEIAPVIANNSEQQPLCRPIKGTGDQGGEFIFVSTVTPNQYQPNKISAPQIAAPKSKKISFDDIIKMEQEQQAVKQQWNGWQKNREDEYSQVKRLDISTSLNAVHKKEVWLRFSSGMSQDNPFSTRDDEMRKYALKRISFWENESSNKKKITNQDAKLEQERKEQERLKVQKKEKQRLELEQKKLEVEKKNKQKPIKLASVNPIDKQSKIVARDGQYVKYETGIIFDKVIGLEWFQGPNDELDWEQAKDWIKELKVDEKNGWRMPTKDELFSLFKEGIGSKNMTGLFNPTSWWVWCDKQTSFFSSPDVFNFYVGRKNMKTGNRAKHNSVLAVRKKNSKATRKFEQIEPNH